MDMILHYLMTLEIFFFLAAVEILSVFHFVLKHFHFMLKNFLLSTSKGS